MASNGPVALTLFHGARLNSDAVIKQADPAMYRTKADGRNCQRM